VEKIAVLPQSNNLNPNVYSAVVQQTTAEKSKRRILWETRMPENRSHYASPLLRVCGAVVGVEMVVGT